MTRVLRESDLLNFDSTDEKSAPGMLFSQQSSSFYIIILRFGVLKTTVDPWIWWSMDCCPRSDEPPSAPSILPLLPLGVILCKVNNPFFLRRKYVRQTIAPLLVSNGLNMKAMVVVVSWGINHEGGALLRWDCVVDEHVFIVVWKRARLIDELA
jgi:hypothetical protein